jgi:nucleoside-diphosphate-sugar epimerase
MKKILILGAGGFIGTHLTNDLKNKGHYVIGADLKYPKFSKTTADEFYIADLRDTIAVEKLITSDIDMIYQLAADMGGAGYIFVGNNDADIMHNSAKININVVEAMVKSGVKNVLFTSSACVYPQGNQENLDTLCITESSAYPADPDSDYGWEKLFSERLYLAFARNYNLNVRVVRLHNVFGPLCSWNDGREKSPAALCRKVAMAKNNDTIDVWGDGTQVRSFLFIDQCLEGIQRIVDGNYCQPLNLGSDRMISINDLAKLISTIAEKQITINNIPGPKGVNFRTSDNTLINEQLGWCPKDNLEYGLQKTYFWILDQIKDSQ